MSIRDARQLDAAALKGLAHPLRIRLLTLLEQEGPATATALASRSGESSGATSYHLRQLARHGFIEEVAGRGKGRERWWQPSPGGYLLRGSEVMRDPSTRRAAEIVLREINRERSRRLDEWLARAAKAKKAWRGAAVDLTYDLRLDPAQLRALVGDLDAVIDAHRTRAAATPRSNTERVEVQLNAFPVL